MIEGMNQILTGRQQDIGLLLLARTGPITIVELADCFKVSERTVRYDLDALQGWLEEKGLSLVRKPRYGVEVVGNERLKRVVSEELTNRDRDHYRYPYTPEERVRFILFHLLQFPDRVVIDDLVRRLGVSRGTLLSDLEEVEEKFAAYDLTLERIPGFGLKLKADEFSWRKAAAAFLISEQNTENVRTLLKHAADWGVYRGRLAPEWRSQLLAWFSPDTLHRIEAILLQTEQINALSFTDRAFYGLVVHIALTLKRLKEHKDIYMPVHELATLRDKDEYRIAQEMSRKLAEDFNVTIPDSETGYITLHLMGAKRADVAVEGQEEAVGDEKVFQYVDGIIDIVQETLNIPLAEDIELRRGLYTHLKPTLSRLQYRLPLENPILPQIRQQYPQIFAATQKSAIWLSKKVQRDIPASEVGYLAMHFGAAIIRLREKDVKSRRILLVCASGVGTAKLFESMLRRELPWVDWVDTVAVNRLQEKVKTVPVDLIISTMNLASLELDIPVITIPPLPNTREINRLKERVYLATDKNWGSDTSWPVSKLMAIIRQYADVHDKDGLYRALKQWWKGHTDTPRVALHSFEGDSPMLDQLLRKDNIIVRKQFSTWREVVDAGGGILLKQGCIKQEYIDKIKENHHDHGPYMVIAPGIVLLHARPEDGVVNVCMSLITLKEPVPFGHPHNDPVDIVITFATLDSEMHVLALSQMMALLSDGASLSKLRTAQSEEEVMHIIQPFVQEGGERQ